MRAYDAVCPICGHRNIGLYLEETNGLMECEKCGRIIRPEVWTESVRFSVLNLSCRPDAVQPSGFPGSSVKKIRGMGMEKKYIDVETAYEDGQLRPVRILKENGGFLNIRRTLHVAYPVEKEFEGIRYTVMTSSAEKYMYLDGNRWYVDPSFGEEDTS